MLYELVEEKLNSLTPINTTSEGMILCVLSINALLVNSNKEDAIHALARVAQCARRRNQLADLYFLFEGAIPRVEVGVDNASTQLHQALAILRGRANLNLREWILVFAHLMTVYQILNGWIRETDNNSPAEDDTF